MNALNVDVVTLDAVLLRRGDARRPASDVQIDATSRFVLPGLINAHTHMQSSRSGQSMGGFDWTIAAGVPYHVPPLVARIREIVEPAKAAG